MDERYRSILYHFLWISLALFVALLVASYATIEAHILAPVVGYLLSFTFVASNLLVLRNFRKGSPNEFYKRFFISLGLRFILVIIAFIIIIEATEIHQIYFTVSFIFSYIFHSIIEIISINKLLKTDN